MKQLPHCLNGSRAPEGKEQTLAQILSECAELDHIRKTGHPHTTVALEVAPREHFLMMHRTFPRDPSNIPSRPIEHSLTTHRTFPHDASNIPSRRIELSLTTRSAARVGAVCTYTVSLIVDPTAVLLVYFGVSEKRNYYYWREPERALHRGVTRN